MSTRPALDGDLPAASDAALQQGLCAAEIKVADASDANPAKDRPPTTRNGVLLLTRLDGGRPVRPVNLAIVNRLRDGAS